MRTRRLLPALLMMFTAALAAAQPMTLDEALPKIGAWSYGGDFAPCQRVIDEINAAGTDAAAQAALAPRLAAALTGASPDAQVFLCRELAKVATPAEVPAIAALLADPKTSDSARHALEAIPGGGVDQALLDALKAARGREKAGILGSLGRRNARAAQEAAAAALKDKDLDVARAAAGCLGALGGAPALAKLTETLDSQKTSVKLRLTVVESLLRGAAVTAPSDPAAAAGAYTRLTDTTEDANIRAAALCGLIRLDPERNAFMLAGAITGFDAQKRKAALNLARILPPEAVTLSLCRALPDMPDERRAQVVAVLADRADPAAAPHVYPLLDAPALPVRMAAITALGVLGNGAAVPPLVKKLSAKPEEAGAAAGALAVLKGDGVDGFIAAELAPAAPPVRAALLGVLGDRAAAGQAGAIAPHTADPNPAVRAAAFKALGRILPPDQAGTAAEALAAAPPDTLETAGNALAAVLRRAEPGSGAAAQAAAVLAKTRGTDARAALVRALGASADPAVLDTLVNAAKYGKKEVRLAAIDTLGGWPTPEPLDAIRKLAKRARAAYREAALDALLRLLKAPSDRGPADTLAVYREVLPRAGSPETAKKIISGMAGVRDRAVLEALAPYAAQEQYKAEALAAMDRVRALFFTAASPDNPGGAGSVLDNDPETRWRGGAQAAGKYLQIDLGETLTVTGVILDSSRSPGDIPAALEVFVSAAPDEPGQPVAATAEVAPVTRVDFAPVAGRHVRVAVSTPKDGANWTVCELSVAARP